MNESLKQKIQDRIDKNQGFIDRHKKDLNVAAGIVEGENKGLKWVLSVLGGEKKDGQA